ncbi:MAG: hypothetical protein OHK0046_26770 [Anaerolineae bacterium]
MLRLVTLLAGIILWLLHQMRALIAFILRLLFGLFGRGARLTGRGLAAAGSSATTAAGSAMARRSARSEMDTGLVEDPLRVQNRMLSVLVVMVLLLLIGVVLWATSINRPGTPSAGAPIALNPSGDTPIDQSGDSPLGIATPVPTGTAVPEVLQARGSLAYTVRENGQTDLWVSPVDTLAKIRLTNAAGDERDPVFDPQGQRIAYASNKDGNWEIYIYDLPSRTETRMTYNLGFEGAPQWSPDGLFLVYESYQNDGHLDIFVMPSDGSSTATRLTNDPAPDFSPSWSPDGRRIAFTSWRAGNQDIYIFDLNTSEVFNLTNTPDRHEDWAAWSPDADGDLLTYSAVEAGVETVFVKSSRDPNAPAEAFRRGRTPAWSPDGASIVYAVDTREDTRILVSPYLDSGVTTEVIQVPSGSGSPDWSSAPLPAALINAGGVEPGTTEALFVENVSSSGPRYILGPIQPDIENLDQDFLNERVIGSFNALREAVNAQVGFDFFGLRLEHALWNLEYRPQPGEERRNWHMTGRAVSFNRRLTTGFPPEIEIVREDGEIATFWRVFVRVTDEAQNGQLGEPLRRMPWVFVSPESGDVEGYDQGGRFRTEMPRGYYVDLTQLALDYGWQRVAAGSDWRTNFNARNFWMFIKPQGLSWYDAMLELYSESQLGGFVPTATPQPILPTPAESGEA